MVVLDGIARPYHPHPLKTENGRENSQLYFFGSEVEMPLG